ncbi:S24 family peptidase [Fructilactobacillus sanfranciscensis]|uniref:LexA family protein n=1 Tax=Fructilactobacillus sanfranciscensis TaxID=1625 RepID=UPI0031F83836
MLQLVLFPYLEWQHLILFNQQPTHKVKKNFLKMYKENGQIAAILLEDENTATLKRIKKTKTGVILMPDNPEYEPIILNEDRRGRILGIVKMEMKRF